jgi:hypothetical protein
MRSIIIAAALSSGFLATVTAHDAHAAENPCKPLEQTACEAETHCKWNTAKRITYTVAGKDYTKDTKAKCALRIKKKLATVTELAAAQ